MMCVGFLCRDLGTEELAGELVLYVITHGEYTAGTEIRTVLWRGCCYPTKPWQLQSTCIRAVHSEDCLYVRGRATT